LELSGLIETTNAAFRNIILLCHVYVTFNMVYGLFLPIEVGLRLGIHKELLITTAFNMMFMASVLAILFWFTLKCEVATQEVYL
jgi:hypothetical protein